MQLDDMFLEKMLHKEIDYFSITLFQNGQKILSHCNNKDWLEKYNSDYLLKQKFVPVQKYILGSASKLIIWDVCSLDKSATEYINIRNSIVGVSTNISIVLKKENALAVITLGTKRELPYLLNLINTSVDLVEFETNLLACL